MPRKFSLHATISVCRHTDMVYSKPKNSGIWHTLIKVVYPLTQRKILAYLDLGGGGEGWPRAFAPQGHGLGVSRPPEPDIFNCIMGVGGRVAPSERGIAATLPPTPPNPNMPNFSLGKWIHHFHKCMPYATIFWLTVDHIGIPVYRFGLL